MRPLIGLTLDSQEPGGYSKMPWYAQRKNYAEAVMAAGGIPILLPHHMDCVDHYVQKLDGLILTGGNFDIPPSAYGEDAHPTVTTKPGRTEFEWQLFDQMYAKGKAILGICGGMQLVNVALGGTLIQHIPDAVDNALAHEQPNPRTEPGHDVKVEQPSQLFDIVGAAILQVNTAHHQAVKKPASSLRVSAYADDGVIEAIEDTQHPFCLGVQWHPEYHVCEGDKRIFQAFIQAIQK